MRGKDSLILVLTALALVALAGCNTVKGVGKDIHDSAQNIQEWIEGGSQNSDHIANADQYRSSRP